MPTRLWRWVAVLLAPAAGAAALGQDFNLDVGVGAGSPSATYGAGADQSGQWMVLDPDLPGASYALHDIGGVATAARASFTHTGTAGYSMSSDNPNTFGDDEALMDDIQDCGSGTGVTTWTFKGLQPGSYLVYTYAWAPDDPTGYTTVVEVPGSPHGAQTVGGAWPGTQQEGVTFAMHEIEASGGTFDVVLTVGSGFASLNGFQISRAGNTCTGSTFCTAKVNSLGCTPAIGAWGTASISDPGPFEISARKVLSNRPGLLFYGLGTAAFPFQGGWLCVQPPIARTWIQYSGGNPPPYDCSGRYTLDFNAHIQSGVDPLLVAGVQLAAQYWSRDPGSPSTTGLTDAIEFAVCP